MEGTGRLPYALAALGCAISACVGATSASSPTHPSSSASGPSQSIDIPLPPADDGPHGVVRLAFVGDMHFQLHLAAMLDHPDGALGPITKTLQRADLAMANLESSITARGLPEPKDFHFRTTAPALDVLDAAGIDVVTMGNNHAVDYGQEGLTDTLHAIAHSPVAVVGIGRDSAAAYRPHIVSVSETDIAFLAASTKRERTSAAWSAGPDTPGIAVDLGPGSLLVDAVRDAAQRADVVVVYLHWGVEGRGCPGAQQRATARTLAAAGADVIVGSHAHVLLGAGWMGDTYVSYGLANFLWYHNHDPETGVLQVRIEDGEVTAGAWAPAQIQLFGRPLPLHGIERAAAIADWNRLRACTGLAATPTA
ncbi:MAG TPA: CapA family protein [Nocardioidaceae bacterium]|nr:CapA family protein [Nocardioidaceae bacterium]